MVSGRCLIAGGAWLDFMYTGPKNRFPIPSVVEDMCRTAVNDISCSFPAHFSSGKCGVSSAQPAHGDR